MRLEVALVPAEVRPRDVRGRFVVVVDVLRAGTSVAVALANGAREVVPVASVRKARQLAATSEGGNVLLCGERGGLRLPQFDLGNSPREYSGPLVAGRRLIFTSSNATYALQRVRAARTVVLAALVNVDAVARKACNARLDVTVVLAGRSRRFGLDDFLAAGFLVRAIRSGLELREDELDDAARLALEFAQAHAQNPLAVLSSSVHGRILQRIGFGDDLPLCSGLNSLSVVPTLVNGVLVADTGTAPEGNG